ncbi:MAG: NigD-like protein [Bacteroidales bacterium]|nr:NigD-like protein [Bacteroidales bacterium]
MISAMASQSCFFDLDDKDETNYPVTAPNALVTVKPSDDGKTFRLVLNDSTDLHVVNLQKPPFGNREVRALVNYRKPTDEELEKGGILADIPNVYLNWIDSIRTKPMVKDLGAEENAKTYGNDELEIVNSWATIVEDGYLTLRFRTYWGDKSHTLNLVRDTSVTDSYKVILYHNANGDIRRYIGDAMIAFKLDDLPAKEGKVGYLTLEWNSYGGPATVKFKY